MTRHDSWPSAQLDARPECIVGSRPRPELPGSRDCCIALLAGLLLVAAGCTVGPDYHEPHIELPPSYGAAGVGPATQPADLAQWWTRFGDHTLNALVCQAVQNNKDLRIAAARVREARSLRRIAASDAWPSVGFGGSYRRWRRSESIGLGELASQAITGGAIADGFSGWEVEQDTWRTGFDASWELDIFGHVRRSVEAADADVAASEESRRDILVSLLAEVAACYLDLRGLQDQLRIARQNIQAQEQTVALTQSRLNAGLASELDLQRARAQVATTRSQLPVIEAGIGRDIHRIGVLTGRAPADLAKELSAAAPVPPTPPMIPVGLPSDLLWRRPDVRRAERQLAAATARIGIATAQLFPRFSLTGNLGLQANSFERIGNWDSRFWGIGPAFSFPIFDRAKIHANIEVQNARQQQALAAYENAVLRALEDVENALINYAQRQLRTAALEEAVRANRRAVELANELYVRGLVDFLSVLEAQRSLYQAEEQLAASRSGVNLDLVYLYKALGGGWDLAPPQTQPTTR